MGKSSLTQNAFNFGTPSIPVTPERVRVSIIPSMPIERTSDRITLALQCIHCIIETSEHVDIPIISRWVIIFIIDLPSEKTTE